MRSRLRAEHRAADEDRRGPVEFLRLRRHQRLAHLPPLQRLSQAGGPPARTLILRELDVPPGVLRQLAAAQPERYPLLLDSAADGPLSRASVLLATADRGVVARRATGVPGGGRSPTRRRGAGRGFLRALEQWAATERIARQRAPLCRSRRLGAVPRLRAGAGDRAASHAAAHVRCAAWQAFALRTRVRWFTT